MATTYGRKKRKQRVQIHTIFAAFLICTVFLAMVLSFYRDAEEAAYELLHLQTKQIKDDLVLQIESDRENLVTMANFAAKLYADGEDYHVLFESFKPIGLFSGIGILSPDGMFTTKNGVLDLNGKISFEEEAKRGEFISGRIRDLTRESQEIIRSAVPIRVDGKTVGILYGVVPLSNIGEKYVQMAGLLDAQLFVYDKETGKFVIDTINPTPGELSELKTRRYNNGSSFADLTEKEDGFVSFRSILREEDLFVHFSTIPEFNWGIMLARYESQVFKEVHQTASTLLVTFFFIMLVMVGYVSLMMKNERTRARVTATGSGVRKLLLEINRQDGAVQEALRNLRIFSNAQAAFFFDSDGIVYEDFAVAQERVLSDEDERCFAGELFRYAARFHDARHVTVGVMRIVPDSHLEKTNETFYKLIKSLGIRDLSFAIITDEQNHISILGVSNPKKSVSARSLLEEVAVCFTIAIYNKKHLNQTEFAATTDALTGVRNRVAFKRDILAFDADMPEEFACIFIDVNELHILNNKYGHAAGDEMLIYIANSLKDIFFGHQIYRMGGDEFLVFTNGIGKERIKEKIDLFLDQLKTQNYHVAIGISHRSQNIDCNELVQQAEVRMYEAKAQYYQNKEAPIFANDHECDYVQLKTGIGEIDAVLSVLKEHYNGIYRVSLTTDCAHRILMPEYLGYNEDEEHFSALTTKYVEELVHPDSHRAFTAFLNYDAIRHQIAEGAIPRIRYKKVSGESEILSVYPVENAGGEIDNTLWVFAKE